MSKPTYVSFIRHGEVENPNLVYYGRLPGFGLSAEGRRQALAAARELGKHPPDVLYSSRLLRALQTTHVLHGVFSELSLHVSPDLIEVRSRWDGEPQAPVTDRGRA